MHETQWVKALARSLDEAEAQFREHVERLGGPDNWWTMMGAWNETTGEVHVPPPPPLDDGLLLADLTPEERAEHEAEHAREVEEDARVLRDEYASREAWLRSAWETAASSLEVGGLPWMTFGEASPDVVAAYERFRTIPLPEMARSFLASARDLIVKHYADAFLEGDDLGGAPDLPATIAQARRVGLTEAFEAFVHALRDPRRAPHVPFLRGMGPYSWPAHLVGDGDGVIYLMVDMHR
jgi:hypothetical protein